MKKLFLILLVLISSSAHGFFYVGAHANLNYSNFHEVDESVNGQLLTHDGWTLGIGLGARAGLSIGPIFFGGTGYYDKIHFEGEREDAFVQNSFDGAEDYDNIFERTMYGGFFGFRINPNFAILGEIYTESEARVDYATPRGENIFSMGDRIMGDGWGIGLNGQVERLSFGIMVRFLSYDELTSGGQKVNLPNNQFLDDLSFTELSLQLGVAFF